MQIRPFTIQVDDEILLDLRDRLERTRWPDEIEEAVPGNPILRATAA